MSLDTDLLLELIERRINDTRFPARTRAIYDALVARGVIVPDLEAYDLAAYLADTLKPADFTQ